MRPARSCSMKWLLRQMRTWQSAGDVSDLYEIGSIDRNRSSLDCALSLRPRDPFARHRQNLRVALHYMIVSYGKAINARPVATRARVDGLDWPPVDRSAKFVLSTAGIPCQQNPRQAARVTTGGSCAWPHDASAATPSPEPARDRLRETGPPAWRVCRWSPGARRCRPTPPPASGSAQPPPLMTSPPHPPAAPALSRRGR